MNEAAFVDYYALLGVATDAEPKIVRQAFLKLATEHHPDMGGSDEDMHALTRAYKTLTSDSARKTYDLQHEIHVEGVHHYHHDSWDKASIDDLSDAEIDQFLDTLYQEYKNMPKQKSTVKQRLKKLFEI